MRKESFNSINAEEKERLLIDTQQGLPDKKRKKYFDEKRSCFCCMLPLLRMLLNIKKMITKRKPIDKTSSTDSLVSDTSFVSKFHQLNLDLKDPTIVIQLPNFAPAITIGYFMEASTNFQWVPTRYCNGARIRVKSSHANVPWMIMDFYQKKLLTLIVSDATSGNCFFLRGKANGTIRLMLSSPDTDLLLENCFFSLVQSDHRGAILVKHHKTNLYLSENPRRNCLYLTSNEKNASIWAFQKLTAHH